VFQIVTFVVLVGLFSYTKVAVASMLQAEGGRRALLWCGVLTQIGSFIGAISTFVLVNVLQVFVAVYPCT
jgi:riboflavin transporter 2